MPVADAMSSPTTRIGALFAVRKKNRKRYLKNGSFQTKSMTMMTDSGFLLDIPARRGRPEEPVTLASGQTRTVRTIESAPKESLLQVFSEALKTG